MLIILCGCSHNINLSRLTSQIDHVVDRGVTKIYLAGWQGEDRLEKFIIEEGPGEWWRCNNVLMYYCRYSLSTYKRELYDEFSIPFVDSLRRAVDKRQAEYFAGRYCARKALDLINVEVNELPSGKHREPLWPTGIVGSISHSNETASACVSRNENISGLGIDLEQIISPETMEKIQGSVLTNEDEKILSTSEMPNNVLFTILFSLKESFFKAAFSQVKNYFDFTAITVIDIDPSSTEIRCRVNQGLSKRLPEGTIVTGKYQLINKSMVITYVELGKTQA